MAGAVCCKPSDFCCDEAQTVVMFEFTGEIVHHTERGLQKEMHSLFLSLYIPFRASSSAV